MVTNCSEHHSTVTILVCAFVYPDLSHQAEQYDFIHYIQSAVHK